MALGQVVAQRLISYCFLNQFFQARQRCATTQGHFKVYFVVTQQAGAEFTISRQPQPIAVKAEMLANRGNKADAALGLGKAEILGWPVADAG